MSDSGNPNNPPPYGPSTPLQVDLWESSQAQSAAYSDQTDFQYQIVVDANTQNGVLTYPPGAGSQGPGTFFSNGNPPNEGNQP